MSRRIGSPSPAVVRQAEKDIRARLKGQHFDFTAMSAISNAYRAGTAVRNHLERTVLAEEAGVNKGTLTGVIKTLQGRNLIKRLPHHDDRRRVSLSRTVQGARRIEELLPSFNRHEREAVRLTPTEQRELARLLR